MYLIGSIRLTLNRCCVKQGSSKHNLSRRKISASIRPLTLPGSSGSSMRTRAGKSPLLHNLIPESRTEKTLWQIGIRLDNFGLGDEFVF